MLMVSHPQAGRQAPIRNPQHLHRAADAVQVSPIQNSPGCRWTKAITIRRVFSPTSSRHCRRLRQRSEKPRWARSIASQPPPTDVLLTALLNDLTALGDVVLVLDDYHVIESQPIDEALTFFVDHLPPQLRLVIATREDPPLPLARLRARGQLTELRAGDLRFTPSEAADFLNEAMGLNLSARDIAALETRTEGWIAGLQLAALSMQGRSDTASFIQAFTGSHRFVLDYLMEEVLQRQPERVRSFLLQTAILERLSGSLCDAVTERDDGRSMLAALERGNLFVVPLDDQRQWYRYHHLFADVLQARLMEEQPDRVSDIPSAGQRVVRAERSAGRSHPACAGRQRL